jgi:hypothetical protein
MKRANHLIRKADREGLADLGFSEEIIAKLFAQDFAGRVGFPNYALTNNSANIRRLEKRLAAIQNASTTKAPKSNFLVACVWWITLRLIDSKSFSLRFPRKRFAKNSSATGFTGARLPKPGNGTGATAQPTSPN